MATQIRTGPPAYMITRTPSYSSQPNYDEQRLALAERLRTRPRGTIVKRAKGGNFVVRFSGQPDGQEVPVYGTNAMVEGEVELLKNAAGVWSVEVKVEGKLKLKEIAEDGATTIGVCLVTTVLWNKSSTDDVTECPSSLPFALSLPSTFEYERETYELPPTFFAKLSGLPGFVATIDYELTVTTKKTDSHLFGIVRGSTSLSTPFTYYPRTRPALPLPIPLQVTPHGPIATPEWRVIETRMTSRMARAMDVMTKLYIPQSRVFAMSQPIPFYLTLESSAFSLAAYTPFGPEVNGVKLSGKGATQVRLMRQCVVDVRNRMVQNTKTDIWRVDCLGEGKFEHSGDGPSWLSYSGSITIDPTIKVSAFKAAGLAVRDAIVFSISPRDARKAPFNEVRVGVTVRLTTDAYTADGHGWGITHHAMDSSESLATRVETPFMD